jgi:hypothetical protein
MKTQLPRYAVLITRKNGSTKQVGSFGDRAMAVEYGEAFYKGRYHIVDRMVETEASRIVAVNRREDASTADYLASEFHHKY